MDQYEAKQLRKEARDILYQAKGPPLGCYWCNKPIKDYTGDLYYNRPGVRQPHDRATADHIINLGDGGTNDPTNLEWACVVCNNTRGYRRLEALRAERTPPKPVPLPRCQGLQRFDNAAQAYQRSGGRKAFRCILCQYWHLCERRMSRQRPKGRKGR